MADYIKSYSSNRRWMMGGRLSILLLVVLFVAPLMLGMTPGLAHAFDSGSTGEDGAFAPAANTTLDLAMPHPDGSPRTDGVFNFTTINIPAGVRVFFKRNASNTPVTFLASGDVTIAGEIYAHGTTAVSNATPGLGGPGGFDGGIGGTSYYLADGTKGEGPGGGFGAVGNYNAGAGGGGSAGSGGTALNSSPLGASGAAGGSAYGNAYMTPLIGGSGGGGGGSFYGITGVYGGGGGGAILIASSGTINVSGAIWAYGGNGGIFGGDGYGQGTDGVNHYFGGGGGGGGGMIHLIADTITGEGTIQASGGSGGNVTYSGSGYWDGGNGSWGRIRLEADHLLRVANTNPSYVFAYPTTVTFPDGTPSLAITSIGGVQVPEGALGDFVYPDVELPYGTQNPVTVGITATNIPVTTAVTVTVRVSPRKGAESTATSTALSGTTQSSTATASVNLPASEPAILSVYVSVPVVAMFGDGPIYAEGEKVKEIKVSSTMGGGSELSYITESGREVLARLY